MKVKDGQKAKQKNGSRSTASCDGPSRLRKFPPIALNRSHFKRALVPSAFALRGTNRQKRQNPIKTKKKARHQLQQLQAVALGGEEGATGRGRRTIDQKRHGKER